MCAPRGRMKASGVQASGSLAGRKERVAFHKSRTRDHLLAVGLPYSNEAAELLAEAPLTFYFPPLARGFAWRSIVSRLEPISRFYSMRSF